MFGCFSMNGLLNDHCHPSLVALFYDSTYTKICLSLCLTVNVCLCEKELGKLSDKSVLSAVGSSPVVTPRRPPEEQKSNILKAQAEAAAHKVNGLLCTSGQPILRICIL